MVKRLTAAQVYSVNARVLAGNDVESFLKEFPEYPPDETRRMWSEIKDEVDSTPLPPGAFWSVPSEW